MQYYEYPQTAGDLPFGTVVQRNVLANLHDHLSGGSCCIEIFCVTLCYLPSAVAAQSAIKITCRIAP